MRIGIIETGKVVDPLAARHGDYPDMFARLVGAEDDDFSFRTFSAVDGTVPADPGEADGWLVTGSRHGVYDDLPWIAPLKAFLRDCLEQGVPVVGICFGHQILAEAMGGRVVKSDKGWGLGVQSYRLTHAPNWVDGVSLGYAGHAVHQDQVVDLPPDATVLATSDFCEYAMLAYGNPESPKAISVQSHPEFTAEFVQDLLDVRLRGLAPDAVVDAAARTIGRPVNNADWARWIARFLRNAAKPRASAQARTRA
jgi:GMP synthase-like glutamine amidotransferase